MRTPPHRLTHRHGRMNAEYSCLVRTGSDHAALFISGDDLVALQHADRIVDLDFSVNHDRLQLGSTIRHDQLWFSRTRDDLNIGIAGSSDRIQIGDWFLGPEHQIEAVQAGDGYVLDNTRVDQLVQAMAGFTPPASGELDLSADLREPLEPVLAANWQAA